MARKKRFIVLMVDDDEDDWILVKDAFKENGFSCEFQIDLRRLVDGVELLEYLEDCKSGGNEASPLPHLILLDLNMPRMGGKEALKEIKSHPACRSIPIVIFTTSSDRADIIECYQCGCSSYIEKPQTYESLKELVRTLSNYWMCTAHLPGS